MTVREVIDEVIDREGGFVNHPADRGGATNFGITAATLGQWRRLGRPATPREVEMMTRAEAVDIYTKRYVMDPGFHELPEAILAQVVDDAVLSGPSTAIKALQRVLRVEPDGVLGPMTKSALAQADLRAVSRALVQDRVTRLTRIVKKDVSQVVFLEGWISRAMGFLA